MTHVLSVKNKAPELVSGCVMLRRWNHWILSAEVLSKPLNLRTSKHRPWWNVVL